MLHHEQNLLVGGVDQVPGGRAGVPHQRLQVGEVVSGDDCRRSDGDGRQNNLPAQIAPL